MLRRLVPYGRWVLREYFEKGTIPEIYDGLARSKRYETLIDYPVRVRGFRKGMQYVKNKYNRVLDIASGTGAVIDALPEKKSKTVIGLDFSKEMLAIAKKRFAGQKNIQFRLGDFMSTDFPASSFDLITIANSIRFVPWSQEEMFAQKIAKWLKKKGTFVVFEMVYPLMGPIDAVLKIFGLPRGQNTNMRNLPKFVQIMSRFLRHEQTKIVNTQDIFHKTISMYFRKI